jgi:putative PIN family toxin of toxin-antitoxin system
MIVVLDTNIWVSAIIWGGIPDEIISLQEQRKIEIASSRKLLSELENTFKKKKIQTKLEVLQLTTSSAFSLVYESVNIYSIEELIVPELRDPDDTIVLATVIDANAEVIITGDLDLLILQEYQNMQIMTATDFLEQYFNL